jgi:glyoxylase-like metal-dependent hydrolase (beta-lactamase superfamily II)
MTIKTFTFNPIQENTYLIYDETNEAVVIDAGCVSDIEKRILKNYIETNELILKHVWNTHLHFDHQFGNKFLYTTYGIKPEAGKEDEYLLEDMPAHVRSFGLDYKEEAQPLGGYITDGQTLTFGNTTFTAFHVPGHSPGSLAFYAEKEGVLLAGDVLFRGSIGRTDLPGGDYATLINSITKKLLTLPDSTIVYCGHGPTTTIGYEKKNNPFL